MPRYFFHSRDGVVHTDKEGLDLPGERAARLEGVRYLAELVRGDVDDVLRTGRMEVTVVDTAGVVVGVLSFTSSDGRAAE